MDIVLATSNPHKVEELRAIFAGAGLDGVTLLGLGELGLEAPLEEPRETGSTFEENATIKAVSYAAQTRRVCLADDSGLEVDALGGGPGVISSHYGTDGRETGMTRAERDAANTARLLRELEGVEEERRGARFVCVMVAAGLGSGGLEARHPTEARHPFSAPAVVAVARGVFEGRIGKPGAVPRGGNGFGYDPVFLVAPGFRVTSAELSPAEKNRLSHRGRAARGLVEQIKEMLAGK